MTRNMGTADRAIRVIVGLVLFLLPLVSGFAAGTPWLWWASLIVGLVMIATSAIGFCPAYTLLGVRTCRSS